MRLIPLRTYPTFSEIFLGTMVGWFVNVGCLVYNLYDDSWWRLHLAALTFTILFWATREHLDDVKSVKNVERDIKIIGARK